MCETSDSEWNKIKNIIKIMLSDSKDFVILDVGCGNFVKWKKRIR